MQEANILAAFKEFDTDHSGALSRPEIAQALSAMGSTEEEIQARARCCLIWLAPLVFHAGSETAWKPHAQMLCCAPAGVLSKNHAACSSFEVGQNDERVLMPWQDPAGLICACCTGGRC
jgi:hypothetical protein